MNDFDKPDLFKRRVTQSECTELHCVYQKNHASALVVREAGHFRKMTNDQGGDLCAAGIERYAFALSAHRLKSQSIAANVFIAPGEIHDVDLCHYYNGPCFFCLLFLTRKKVSRRRQKEYLKS